MNPCPVKIDFGDVSVAMRNFLRKEGQKKFNPMTAMTMGFLTVKDPATIKLMRKATIEWGMKGQRFGHKVMKSLG